jgi:ubiquinone/menaquinone biosynthesis C-methylase UbiE
MKKNSLTGKGQEAIPNVAFRVMTAMMRLMDILFNSSARNFKTLGLSPGQTVIDYGCGPARYIKNASDMVGKNGRVIAVDIHPLAIKNVQNKIRKYQLTNVETVLTTGYNTGLNPETADVVYALDMFHMIEQPKELLFELARLVKKEGRVIIEDGHQPRAETRKKIESAGVLKMVGETNTFVECKRQE